MRDHLRRVAADTLEILGRGWYVNAAGDRVELDADLARALLHRPGEPLDVPAWSGRTVVEVAEQSTLQAAARLDEPCVLNFASARKPGGGFMNGAQAQEESLARASSLYSSLIAAEPFYAFHRASPTLLYSDHMIYSPNVQVFKDDSGTLLARPYRMAVITAAAPNTRKLAGRQLVQVPGVLHDRGGKILALAAHHGHRTLVLGAWGCGVFGNDPTVVAQAFRDQLDGPFRGIFERVVFAVLGERTCATFRRVLSGS